MSQPGDSHVLFIRDDGDPGIAWAKRALARLPSRSSYVFVAGGARNDRRKREVARHLGLEATQVRTPELTPDATPSRLTKEILDHAERITRADGRRCVLVLARSWPELTAAGAATSVVSKSIRLWCGDRAEPIDNPLSLEEARQRLLASTVPLRTELVGSSRAMDQLRKELDAAASLELPVMLVGETGTGKELCARRLHDGSGLPGRLVAVNCALLRPERAASDLFGHVKGAYTGADGERQGRVREADGGTLFLDELLSAQPELQGQLLRALNKVNEGLVQVVPMGATDLERRDVAVRVVTALQRDPFDGTDVLQHDLLFRLAGVVIRVPPLSSRDRDVVELANLRLHTLAAGATLTRLTTDAEEALCGYSWPGNVRQLNVVIQQAWFHACALGGRQELAARDIEPWLLNDATFDGADCDGRMATFGLSAIAYARARHPTNETAAAASAGYSTIKAMRDRERTLQRWLEASQGRR